MQRDIITGELLLNRFEAKTAILACKAMQLEQEVGMISSQYVAHVEPIILNAQFGDRCLAALDTASNNGSIPFVHRLIADVMVGGINFTNK